MCYMAHGRDELDSVGVRELRQNLSVYLRRIKAGEELIVTERGQPVGKLVPLKPAKGSIDHMIELGIIRRPEPHDWRDWTPVPATPGEPTLSEILQQMRDEEYEDE
jgi:prevent-host-death family protein